MKRSIDLKCSSSVEWLDAVMQDFDTFLMDHADCERKASNMAMSLVAKYPDRTEIIPDLIETALEELEHFRDVYQLMQSRNVPLTHMLQKDLYIQNLLALLKPDVNDRFLDRLLLASVIECRGAERFKMIWAALDEGEIKKFYHRLWTSEAKHGNVFVEMALHYFNHDAVYLRLHELMEAEAQIVDALPIRAALH
jgi:tRNA-(ms[2]io[6]A)-hydroxylase